VQSQWENLGVEIEIETFNISTLEREIIKPRNYETLLFGEVLGAIPDPFPFWSSLQKKDPGLNLSLYENKKCDKLLEEARKSLDENERKEKLEEFQDLLIKDAPAVFLYNPDYLYFVSKEIKGIDAKIIANPSKRFIGIENWYIKTKRAWR
jgi:peptide/nickel transport system substrate-binding protein